MSFLMIATGEASRSRVRTLPMGPVLCGFTLSVETAAIYLGRHRGEGAMAAYLRSLGADLLAESEKAATDPVVAVRPTVFGPQVNPLQRPQDVARRQDHRFRAAGRVVREQGADSVRGSRSWLGDALHEAHLHVRRWKALGLPPKHGCG